MACCICDAPSREVLLTSQGRPVRWGKRLPGFRVATLCHVDGSISDHTLCGGCEIRPEDVPVIWERACLLYAADCSEKLFTSHHVDRYCMNYVMGVIDVRDDDRMPVRLEP